MRITIRAALASAAISVLGAAELHAKTYQYQITDLGSLGGGRSVGQALNDSGQVVGESTTGDGSTHAFLYDGHMHDLGTLGGTYSSAFGINRWGQVTGQAATKINPLTGSSTTHAFRHDGTIHDLGTIVGASYDSYSYGHDINANGTVTGDSFDFGGDPMAFSYSAGMMQPLGTLGGDASHAYAINDAGRIVGDAYLPGNIQRAASYYDGAWHDLGTLFAQSAALAISENNFIAGESMTASGFSHAFLFDGAGMRDLGTLGGDYSTGRGVNSSGMVIGWSRIAPGSSATRGFVCPLNGELTDLNSLIDPSTGWVVTGAYAINETGQITGAGTFGGQVHAFLMTRVPEPSATGALLCVVALAGHRLRKSAAYRTSAGQNRLRH